MDDYDKVKFGALLHDVGKFVYRTKFRMKHGKLGEIYTQLFVPEDISNNIIGLMNPSPETKKSSKVAQIVNIADMLVSCERKKLGKEEIERQEKEGTRDVLKKPLKSVFSQIKFKDRENTTKDRYYQPGPINLDDSIFPVEREKIPEKNGSVFSRKIFDDFEIDMKKIKSEFKKNEKTYYYKLLHVLRKHFSLIPSAAWVDKPDVSLYDHSRVTSAIGVALYLELKKRSEYDIKHTSNIRDYLILNINKGKFQETKERIEKREYFSLIQGDLSGIQKFIYTISSKSALKTLKGRSAFLVLLNEVLAYHVLHKLNLPVTNLLFCGGGHFYILANKSALQAIHAHRNKINRKLLHRFKGKIYLSLNGIHLSLSEFDKKIFSEKWQEVSKQTSKLKRMKWFHLIETNDDFEKIFGPYETGGEYNRDVLTCSICNDEYQRANGNFFTFLTEDQKKTFKKIFEDENLAVVVPDKIDLIEYIDYDKENKSGILSNERFCKTCNSYINFTNNVLINQKKNSETDIIIYKRVLENFKVLKEFELDKKIIELHFHLNSTKQIPYKFFPLGIPYSDSEILDFETLADNAYKRTGTRKIGILKMDIDDLGKIFTKGLKNNKTISRLSTLSSMIANFFEGYVNYIINSKKFNDKNGEEVRFKENIYLIFSGGDDLFAVGAWDAIMEFAKTLNNDFRKYVCYNPEITLSAGIVIVDPKHPISKSAEFVEEALDKSKNSGKKRIYIFGETFVWDWFQSENIDTFVSKFERDEFNELNEFSFMYCLKKELVDLIIQYKVSRSILQRIKTASLGMNKILTDSKREKLDVARVWRLKYHVARNYFGKNNTELERKMKNILKLIDAVVKFNVKIIQEERRIDIIENMNIFTVAARLAELETKKIK